MEVKSEKGVILRLSPSTNILIHNGKKYIIK